jgi:hypothetical protein
VVRGVVTVCVNVVITRLHQTAGGLLNRVTGVDPGGIACVMLLLLLVWRCGAAGVPSGVRAALLLPDPPWREEISEPDSLLVAVRIEGPR